VASIRDNLPILLLTGEAPTVAPAGADVLSELLGIWEDELRRHRFPVSSATSRGLPPDQVAERLEGAGLTASPELIAWFSWKNGQPMHNNTPPLVPGIWMSGIEWAVNDTAGAPRGTDPFQWSPTWIRLGWDKITLAADSATTRVRVFDYEQDTWEPTSHTEVLSLCTAVTWYIEALRSGGHIWKPEIGEWDRDPELIDPIGRAHMYL
jgi:hypothetical protein